MNSISANQIRKFLKEIVQVGIILSLCFRVSGSPTTRAQEADTQTEPPTNGSLSIEKQSISQFGWFSVIWGDGLDGASHTIYTLTNISGHTTVLLLDERLAQSMGGVLSFDRKYVSVQGVWTASLSDQSALAVMNVSSISLVPLTGMEALEYDSLSDVIGSKPWISIMCRFNDQVIEPKNLAYFQGMYADVKPGLDHYWRELSYDTANVAGSNADGWFVLPHPEAYYNPSDTLGGTNLNLLATDCTAAADASVNFALYQNGGINMMFNTDFDNGYASGGSKYMTLDGVSKVWRTTWEPPWAYASISVIAHEMGHGFGLPHSSGAYGATYDNAWDVMSKDRFGCPPFTDPTYGCMAQHTISYHKDILGWIPAGQKFTAGQNTNTTITLEQLALPTNSNYKMAQIPIIGSSTHFYTVEVRQQTGYDVKLPGQAVVIHEVDTTRDIPAHVIDADGNHVTGDAGAMWTVGETFSDPANSITVSISSATATGFQVSIITLPFRTISGYVRTSTGTGISNVVMNGMPHIPATDANGYYSDQVINGWSGTITPSKAGYVFSPTSRTYSNIQGDQTDQNYTATLNYQIYLPMIIHN